MESIGATNFEIASETVRGVCSLMGMVKNLDFPLTLMVDPELSSAVPLLASGTSILRMRPLDCG
jgi:hypothetical protein